MNKSLITNLTCAAIIIVGYFSPVYSEIIFMTGVFAISGSITNWLAVHMLFEKIPFLYGSGVIPNRFEDFKTGIKNLIINEFFSKEHIERFFKENAGEISADSIASKIDFDHVFESLKDAIAESSFGSMLGMFGGKDALDPLKEPVIEKLKSIINELANGNNKTSGSSITDVLIEKVEKIIDERLNELTPQMVKNIVQDMIRKHLGWLVVWGGVFGGLIGLLISIISN